MNLSVITINYNNAAGLERTMNSVLSQTTTAFEYIVIDGGSKDRSIEVIQKHTGSLAYWVSEPDKGIYHAMNKGVKQARGEYLLFLNSGDELVGSGVIQQFNELKVYADIQYGDLVIQLNDGSERVLSRPTHLTFMYFVDHSLPHPASFIRRSLFQTVGLYDEALKVNSDWKFFIDAICKHNHSYQKIDLLVARFYADGISSNPANAAFIRQEKWDVLKKDYPFLLSGYAAQKADHVLAEHIRSSRLIRLLRKLGLLSNINLEN